MKGPGMKVRAPHPLFKKEEGDESWWDPAS